MHSTQSLCGWAGAVESDRMKYLGRVSYHIWSVFSIAYDGEHLTARFSVSTGVKIKNFMRMKIKNNMKRIIEVYHNKYFIAKFALK